MSTGASPPSEYISKGETNTSYRPKGYGISPGLQRARAPFRFRNAITGVIVSSFVVGVWAYSISAVKQDNFDDVDEEARALVGSGRMSLEDEAKARSVANERLDGGNSMSQSTTLKSPEMANTSLRPDFVGVGLLAPMLDRHFPRFLDPTQKTLVWGAPPLDRLGRLSQSR